MTDTRIKEENIASQLHRFIRESSRCVAYIIVIVKVARFIEAYGDFLQEPSTAEILGRFLRKDGITAIANELSVLID